MSLRRAAVCLLALAVVWTWAGCGDDDSVSQEELEQAKTEAAREAREKAENEAELQDLQEQVKELQEDQQQAGGDGNGAGGDTTVVVPGSGGVPSDADDCGAGVFARSGTTSCAFALNVASDYYSSPSNTFESYSPTTGTTYTMTCSGSAPVVCTGGNNAAVYIP
jgi:hypothetical protein